MSGGISLKWYYYIIEIIYRVSICYFVYVWSFWDIFLFDFWLRFCYIGRGYDEINRISVVNVIYFW